MEVVVISDIHGSEKYTKMIFDYIDKNKIDKVIILGDLYYNGPRNDLPDNYSSKEVVKILNNHKDIIYAIRGNCDALVDEMVSEFPLVDVMHLRLFNKKIIMSHGHNLCFDNLPNEQFDIFMQGHTHKSYLVKNNNKILLNPGSISLPKDNYHSFIKINEKNIQLINLENLDVLKEIDL